MDQNESLIKQLAEIIFQLKKAKIIISGRWIGDLGEYFAIKKFKLDRANTKGYDAMDKGKKVEIKTCCSTSRVPQFNFDMKKKNFDYAVLVHLDNQTLFPIKFYTIDYSTIIKYQTPAEKKYNRFDLNDNKFETMKNKGEIVEYFP